MTQLLNPPTETIRRLATIERIESIRDIPDADAIVCARVRGWDVVVRRGDLLAGDECVYFEVDSFIPTSDVRFDFLASRGISVDEAGTTGYVLKTARLRGQYSQGLALPLSEFPEESTDGDLTEALNIVKWDPPMPTEMAGVARGGFPSWFPKTAEHRVQNNADVLGTPGDWVATEKVDGTSMSVWTTENDEGVAQRGWDLEDTDNRYWNMARQLNLHATLRALGETAVVQGELFGPGILGKNPLGVKEVRFLAFTLYIDGEEIAREFWPAALLAIAVPIFDLPFPATIDEAVAQADGIRSLISPDRLAEGIVWRNLTSATANVDGRIVRASVKVISNKFLLKNGG